MTLRLCTLHFSDKISYRELLDFTRISETMRPLEIFDFINNYLGQMEPIILNHQ